MRKILVTMLMCGFALAGCGGGDGDDAFRPPGDPGNPGNPGGPPVAAAQLTVVTSVPSITSDGSQTATITAYARDASNNLIASVPVTFTATSGGLSGATPTTDANGAATATLSTAGDANVRTITVTATSGSLTSNVNVQVVAGGSPGTSTVSMGCGTGASFQAGALCVGTANLSSGGSTSIQAVLQQTDGSLYTQSSSITFSSPCIAQNMATINSPVVTTSGIANATYVATGCSGADVVTATATAGSTSVSATATITVAPGAIGSIVFLEANPENIALRGIASSGSPENSTVSFVVRDQGGGPRPGATVNFSLNTTVGGISLSPSSGVSDANGRVQTVVQSGTVATAVRVTATVQGVTPVLATQSNALTVTTGIPDQDSFSVAVQCPNVEAWNRDGVVVPVTARLADRFNNLAPANTAVTFQTEGGSIVSQCLTSGTTGACSVNWTSSNPRPGVSAVGDPRAGRSTILATAIGEESFTDGNGNGSLDVGETFVDMDERFMDVNENETRETNEPIYDFNNNSTYDTADGLFNGVLCLDQARCGAQVTTGIATDNLIIMSSGNPSLGNPDPARNVSPGLGTVLDLSNSGGSFSFSFPDVNGNPLPQGTTITFTIAATGMTLGQPSSFTVPCTTEPTAYPVSVTTTGAVTAGTLTVRTLSPSGLETVWSYSIQP